MLGFLRWTFQDCYKNIQFWALSLVLLALVAQLGGCPDPVPWYMSLVAIFTSVLDTVIMLIKALYQSYKSEQNRIVTELSRK